MTSTKEGRRLFPSTRSWIATGEALQIVKSTIEAGGVFAPHSHPHEQFCVVLSGEIEFEVDGRGTHTLGANGVFYFAPNERHGAKVIGDEPVTILEAFHPIRADYLAEGPRDHDAPT